VYWRDPVNDATERLELADDTNWNAMAGAISNLPTTLSYAARHLCIGGEWWAEDTPHVVDQDDHFDPESTMQLFGYYVEIDDVVVAGVNDFNLITFSDLVAGDYSGANETSKYPFSDSMGNASTLELTSDSETICFTVTW
jgi:hypothetical protein